MNSDKLKDIKLKIDEKRIERDKYLKIKKRLEYLEKTALVSEYLELKAIENNEIAMLKNEDIISDIFRSNLVYSEDTENIFIYVGTYKIDEYGNEFRVHRFDEVADYEMFKNIESSEYMRVKITDLKDFFENNKVVYIPDNSLERTYYELQKMYFNDVFKYGGTRAFRKLLLKTKEYQ